MNKKPQSITFQRAAAELCVSDSTVKRLIRRGTLHTTKPELVDGHWTRRIFWDKSFRAERARRLNGLKAPRRKHIPAAIDPHDPSPIQTVTPPAEPQPAFVVDGMEHLCSWMYGKPYPSLFINKNAAVWDMESYVFKLSQCSIRAEEAERRMKKFASEFCQSCGATESVCTRCTAILAAACILQLLLAAYYTLCHFNII